VLGPTPIEFSPLFVGQFERTFTVGIREAFPKGNGKFCAIHSRELEELRKWAGCHALIVSRLDGASQYLEIRVVLAVSGIRVIRLGSGFSGLTLQMSRAPQRHDQDTGRDGSICLLDRRAKFSQRNAPAFTQCGARLRDATQEFRMMLQAILEPVIFRRKPDQDSSRTAVASDHDLFVDRQPKILRQIILDCR
jgi:hypothetical protein